MRNLSRVCKQIISTRVYIIKNAHIKSADKFKPFANIFEHAHAYEALIGINQVNFIMSDEIGETESQFGS